jgi:hypothetical protein
LGSTSASKTWHAHVYRCVCACIYDAWTCIDFLCRDVSTCILGAWLCILVVRCCELGSFFPGLYWSVWTCILF